MKVLILTTLFFSLSAHAFQEGSYNCIVDSFTKSKITIKTIEISPGIKAPYVEYAYYSQGITHNNKGIATVDIQVTEKRDKTSGQYVKYEEEILHVLGVQNSLIAFDSNGAVSNSCIKAD